MKNCYFSQFLLKLAITVNFFVFSETLIALNKKCFSSLNDGTTCRWSLPKVENFTLSMPDEYFGTVCCHEDGLGCFTNRPGTSFECTPSLPECMNTIRPEFLIYTPSLEEQTKNTNDECTTIDFFDLNNSVEKLTIQSYDKMVVLIHGFGNEWPKPWLMDMTDAFLALDYNVLVVKWTGGSQNYSSFTNYFKAASNARTVGAAVAKVLNVMNKHNKINLASITIVGYSLGAHVAGYAGHRLPGIGKIVGLDPAGPLFTCQNPMVRLDPTDATFVEIVHTNGDSFFDGGVGTMQRMGHVDYYVNGGRIQPGCQKEAQHQSLREKLSFISWNNNDFWCSHTRAAEIFIELITDSINSTCKFEAFHCQSENAWLNGDCIPRSDPKHLKSTYFQWNSDYSVRGKLYFNTRSKKEGGKFCGTK